jgi:FtsP/CotA-like multicopper oxidase with cupredoxin domain
MQLPGPTLIVDQDSTITVLLNNNLPASAGNVSIVFPGHQISSTSGGVPGPLTQEAPSGGSVSYTFTAGQPGTYQYHSGTQSDLQVEMGLYGALIVRPSAAELTTAGVSCTTGAPAYVHASTCYDREYLYLLSEIDIDIHQAAELQAAGSGPIQLPKGAYVSEYWLMNGRVGPDTMASDGTDILPTQPYGSLTTMYPGERLLIRLVGAGREMHPFHHHGNHSRLLAVDGRMLLNSGGNLAGPLLFTIPSIPGETADAIFQWSGKDLGWDIYGTGPDYAHTTNGINVPSAGFDSVTHEYCSDHNKPIPVDLPDLSNLAFGGFWGGSPYLGVMGSLPPGEGGLNPNAGFAFMWHSHTERELVNNDVFPGGMMTMMIVEPRP